VEQYRDKYPNSRFTIVGKGPTRFDYANLGDIEGPIIFLNDAVQQEGLAGRSAETFLFSHDQCQMTWIEPGLTSTVVIPRANAVSSGGKQLLSAEVLGERGNCARCITYEWRDEWRQTPQDVAYLTDRDKIATTGHLYIRSGTIHTAIHFAWLCGATEITFIGCDGAESAGLAYDKRIAVRSGGKPLHVFLSLIHI